jgi:Holliday junction resolvase RusA-like endonuclease
MNVAIIAADPGKTAEIRFIVPGEPCAKGRPKASIVCGHVHMRTPKKTENYEARVCLAANEARPSEWQEFDGPIEVEVVAVFSRPDRLLQRSKRTNMLLHGTEDRMPHTSRPDLDNVIKAVLDGMDSAGIWRDDSRVFRLVSSKWYAAIGELPHVEVIVRAVENP